MYRIFRVPSAQKGLIDVVLNDDLAGRQSILQRDAVALGVGGEGTILLVEGSEAGVTRAEALLKDSATALRGAEAETAYARFRSQDDEAAVGMGLVFGP